MERTRKKMKEITKNYLKTPKNVQNILPVERIYEDGIFQLGNLYSQTFSFSDINYAIASQDEREAIFLNYSELLNSIDSSAYTQVMINNETIDADRYMDSILIEAKKDGLNHFRDEYNDMLEDKTVATNNLQQQKYITLSTDKKSIEEARLYFNRLHNTMEEHLKNMGSNLEALDAKSRLHMLHSFFRPQDIGFFDFDIKERAKRGHGFKEYVLPANMRIKSDFIEFDGNYARVMFIKDFATFIKDDFVAELSELPFNLTITISMFLTPTHEAIDVVQKRLLGVESNIHKFLQRQAKQDNFSGSIPYSMQMQRNEVKEFLDDLMTRDQRMVIATITIMHTAESLSELNEQTENIEMTARRNMCQASVLRWEQIQGLQTTLPFGLHNIHATRTLTTESVAVFMPFQAQNIFHEGGIYYGQNIISKKPIVVKRDNLLNGNSFILGIPGSGKSFFAKKEIVNTMLATDYDVLIIDPEREYSELVKRLGGEILRLSANSQTHINPLDLNDQYSDGANPLSDKSEFIMSLFQQVMSGYVLGATEKSIIDRSVREVYKELFDSKYTIEPPTLVDLHASLSHQKEIEAENLALALEMFVTGSLDSFSHKTNVDSNNRLLCFDILDLGDQLKPVGMLVILDFVLNRITKNREAGKRTLFVIDEIYLLFLQEYASNFLYTLWKRVRKYGAYAVGITQNVDDLLQSSTARTMLANSEFIILLNQASTDRMQLGKLLNISDIQLKYVNDSNPGEGLLKIGKSIVPFADKFPQNTDLYKLMTTKPGES